MADHVGEWAGLPIGIDGEALVVDPSYKWASVFNKAPDTINNGDKLRNSFWSTRRRCTIHVGEVDGKITFGVEPGIHHFNLDLHTLGCSFAWGLEQESRAMKLLSTLVKPHAFKQYMLTGMFLESSARSRVSYMFRRLKPTVAMVVGANDRMRILCGLCMHPIAYYAESWAGAMCPTDDVIAHLMLMRADEPMLWRRCNQHPAWSKEAGL